MNINDFYTHSLFRLPVSLNYSHYFSLLLLRKLKMYSNLSCPKSSQNEDQSIRTENALFASQNLFIFLHGCGDFVQYKVRLSWRLTGHQIQVGLGFAVVLIRKEEGRREMFPSKVTHTHTHTHTHPHACISCIWETYILEPYRVQSCPKVTIIQSEDISICILFLLLKYYI